MLKFIEWALLALVAAVNAVLLACVIMAGWADHRMAHTPAPGRRRNTRHKA